MPTSEAYVEIIIEKLKELEFAISDISNPDSCVICLDKFQKGTKVIALPCDPHHIFHSVCISKWVQEKKSCPLDRKRITKKKLELYKQKTLELQDEADDEASVSDNSYIVLEPYS